MKVNKNEFVIAYTSFYGSSKKYAIELWQKIKRENNFNYAVAIINGYRQNARKAFCND